MLTPLLSSCPSFSSNDRTLLRAPFVGVLWTAFLPQMCAADLPAVDEASAEAADPELAVPPAGAAADGEDDDSSKAAAPAVWPAARSWHTMTPLIAADGDGSVSLVGASSDHHQFALRNSRSSSGVPSRLIILSALSSLALSPPSLL